MLTTYRYKIFLIACFIVTVPLKLFAEQIYIPATEGSPGQVVTVPLKVDHIENLAGLKMVLNYNPNVLLYQSVEKSPQTSSMMHVVNDNLPGRLIVVMAGAKGISGKNIDLFYLNFKIADSWECGKRSSTPLELLKIEIVNDRLEQLDYGKYAAPIRISHK